uniref:DUF7923 domain-containing protein n=1 Tax=Candolleomyces aberdarensis TaxID=2316362 RepID=A0A4Q2D3G1_9AGAR
MASGSQLDVTLPETPPVSKTARLVALHKRMKDELDQIVGDEVTTQRMLQELQADLSLSKRAYTSLDSELSALRERSRIMELERDDLLNKSKANRLVVLIDGDGAIFNLDLIAQGQAGGHRAALMLSEGIMRHLPNRNTHQLWVYVFLNKRGLSDAFSRFSGQQARLKLDDFMIGFNQSTERFIMVDVGGAKEAADAKIKALFEAEIRLPQTECIIFAGCHDNGYVTTLRSHITSGSRDKLVLLQSYDEVASGIEALNLPIISIPYLFINQKLAPTATPQPIQNNLPTFTMPMSPKTLASNWASLETKGSHSPMPSFVELEPGPSESSSSSFVNPTPERPLLPLPSMTRELNRAVQNKCKFKGKGMHAQDKASKGEGRNHDPRGHPGSSGKAKT